MTYWSRRFWIWRMRVFWRFMRWGVWLRVPENQAEHLRLCALMQSELDKMRAFTEAARVLERRLGR